MRWLNKGIVAVAVAGIAVALMPAAHADCPPGTPAHTFGNRFEFALGLAATVEFNIFDPNAVFEYSFDGDPAVNQGAFDFRAIFADASAVGEDVINEMFTGALVDMATPGVFGFNGCPTTVQDSNGTEPGGRRMTFTFTDSDGTTLVSIDDLGGRNTWDWDSAVLSSDTPAAGSFAGAANILTHASASPSWQPTITGAVNNGNGTFTVGMSWTDVLDPANVAAGNVVFADIPAVDVPLPKDRFEIIRELYPLDADPNTTPADLREVIDEVGAATFAVDVVISETPGQDTYLRVNCILGNSQDRNGDGRPDGGIISAVSTRLRTDPTIAFPDPRGKARGKGKGLQKDHPGNN